MFCLAVEFWTLERKLACGGFGEQTVFLVYSSFSPSLLRPGKFCLRFNPSLWKSGDPGCLLEQGRLWGPGVAGVRVSALASIPDTRPDGSRRLPEDLAECSPRGRYRSVGYTSPVPQILEALLRTVRQSFLGLLLPRKPWSLKVTPRLQTQPPSCPTTATRPGGV